MRRHNPNSDYMSEIMDDELKAIEQRLTALYANATNAVMAQFNKYAKRIDPELKEWQQLLDEGYISESEYQSRVRNKIFTKSLYKATVQNLTNTLVSTDAAAMAIVRGQLPYVIGQSYNFVQSLGWKAADEAGMSVGTFQIYNANAVQKLIKDNPELLPHVDLPLDEKWNKDRINNVITQGIIQGKDIDTVAKDLQTVAHMDETTATRTARTSMTYAENLGRDESFNDLKKKGMPVRKKWSAVIDERTRDTHRQLNGTYANEQGLFGEGILVTLIRCPADPTGDAEEIYNCRCRLGVVFDNSVVDHSKDDDLYQQFLKENYPDDYKVLQDKDYFNQHTNKPQAPKAQAKKKGAESNAKVKEPPKPEYKTASSRAEADALLKEMGFGRISSGVNKIDEKLYIDNVNRLSELNARFKAITPNMEFATGKMGHIAYVKHTYGNAGSDMLKVSTDYFKGSDSALRYSAKGATALWAEGKQAFWMPISDDYFTTCSLTHEYGHILQNFLLFTPDVADKFNDYWGQGLFYQANNFIEDYAKSNRKRHKDEIIEIAKEIDPEFDIEKNLSKYGHKNTSEFFAECFMNAFCGSPNTLGRAMLIWLERNDL